MEFRATKNSRILQAWRTPIMHGAILFCFYHQMKSFENKHKLNKNPPLTIKYMR